MRNRKPKILFFVLPYVVKDINVNMSKIRSFLAFPYGLLSVVTYNKEYAYFKIVDLNLKLENIRGSIDDAIMSFHPDIIGFTMMFDNSYKSLSGCISMVKQNVAIMTGREKGQLSPIIILGGAAASYSYEDILLEQPSLDAICYSEGEVPVRELIMAWKNECEKEFLEMHSSWITQSNIRLSNKIYTINYIDDLDDVIDIDYSYVDPSKYDMQEAFSPFIDRTKKRNQYFIVTSRGCPFKCRFCSNGKIHGKTMRFASVDRIIAHVKHLVSEYKMNVLTIYDDQLLIDKNRAKDLFRKLAEFNLRIEMPNGLSPAFIDEELSGLMKKAGVDTVYLAIEHGNSYILKHVIVKPLNLDVVKPVVETLRRDGFFIHGFFVIGMPGETHEHRMETVQFIKDINIDWAGLNPATPVRGSELYEECIKKSWISKQTLDKAEDKKYIINAPEIGLTPDIIEEEIYQMNIDVNFRNNTRMRNGNYLVAAECFREVLRRYKGHWHANYYLEKCLEKMKG